MASAADRSLLPDWPRLMKPSLAAAYLSIGETTLRDDGPEPRRRGRAVLYDRRDLDRWADALSDMPLDAVEARAESADHERRFREKRRGRQARG